MSRGRAFLFIFFAGGFAAVLYQTVWQRLLTLFSGADIFSITLVVSAFMAGMGLGSLAGGHLADRLDRRGAVIAFAVCELAIAIFAAASATIYYDWLYLSVGAQVWPRAMTALTIFGVMLWPTLIMGMSLPLAARVLSTDPARPARWLPALYGWNTLGAAAGSLATILLLLPNVDLRTCLLIGAACSTACAVLALAMLRGGLPAEPGAAVVAPVSPVAPAEPAATAGPAPGFRVWMALYALAGFTALSLEIVWFRVFGIALKSNSRTFGALLGIYLVGIGLGALAAEWTRFRAADPRRAFLMVQAAVPIIAAALIALMLAAIGRVPFLEPLTEYFASANPPGARTVASGRIVLLYATVPVALMLPSCLLMGYGFGALHQAAQRDLASLGRRVGWLQAANIAGSTLGAALTGLVLLEVFGAPGTLRLLILCAAPFLAVLAAVDGGLRRAAIGAAAAAATLALLPGGHAFWSGWHATDPARTIVREDATGVVLLREEPAHERTDLLLSGFSQSWLPYGSVHTVLGALPALIHPDPRRVAVIGLGSGDTVFSMGGRDTITSIESIEIVRPQLAALQALNRQQRYPALDMLLADPRVTHHFADGRAYLRVRPAHYDIIEADAIPPWGAYAGNLYSVEFFELLRSCLREGGLAATWTPTDRTRRSFLKVFPHVVMFRYVAIGSDTPIPFAADRIRALLASGFTRDYFTRGAIDIDHTMKVTLDEAPRWYGPDESRAIYTDVNRDLFPQDEFGRR